MPVRFVFCLKLFQGSHSVLGNLRVEQMGVVNFCLFLTSKGKCTKMKIDSYIFMESAGQPLFWIRSSVMKFISIMDPASHIFKEFS